MITPLATHRTPSKAVYTARGTRSLATDRTTRSSSVYRLAQRRRADRIAAETRTSTPNTIACATPLAWRARAPRPAPSSLLARVRTATLKPTGIMNANALVTWKILTAATFSSGSGSHPAIRMFASEAHHSAIIRIPGRASRRNGPHSVSAASALHPSHVSCACGVKKGVRWCANARYPALMLNTTPLLQDVARPAPANPSPAPRMNATFAGTCNSAATTPATAPGFVMPWLCMYAWSTTFHA